MGDALLSASKEASEVQELVHDLSGGQVPHEAALSGCAEGASQGAAHLSGQADGPAPPVAQQDALDGLSVEEAEEHLASPAILRDRLGLDGGAS